MDKTFQIDYVRVALNNVLDRLHLLDSDRYFGTEDIKIYSFYEHLVGESEIQRYVRTYRELTEQQNRTNLKGFGIVSIDETPTITNMYSVYVSPFSWNITIRCKLADRDKMLGTCNALIKELKGRKVDIATLDNGKLIPVETIDEDIYSGCYVGTITSTKTISDLITDLVAIGFINNLQENDYVYATSTSGKLVKYIFNGSVYYEDTTFEQHNNFNKDKLDLSFDGIKINEPYNLNANEYVEITFGGSATLCDGNVRCGNDMVLVKIKKNKIVGAVDYSFTEAYQMLEPLEIPSGNNANNLSNQVRSNFFKVNSHTDSISLTLQYTFMCDMTKKIIREWFNYARYGECNLSSGLITNDSITPNIIYSIQEYWCYWDTHEIKTFNAKIVGDIDIENTESDTLTLGLTFQIQGDNN